jgi:hypothetical protein
MRTLGSGIHPAPHLRGSLLSSIAAPVRSKQMEPLTVARRPFPIRNFRRAAWAVDMNIVLITQRYSMIRAAQNMSGSGMAIVFDAFAIWRQQYKVPSRRV